MSRFGSVLVLVLLWIAADNAAANRSPADSLLERAQLFRMRSSTRNGPTSPVTTALVPQTISLATASRQPIDSRGALVAETWSDALFSSTAGRTIEQTPPSSGLPAVQMVYMIRSSYANSSTQWGFGAYEAVTGTFIAPGGQPIVQETALGEVGCNPKIYVDNSGCAMIAGHDFPEGIDGDAYVHVVRDANPLALDFGYILDGSVMDRTVNQQSNLFAENNNEAIWPTFDVYESGGVHTMYVCVFENDANADDGAVKVYKKTPWSLANPDASWSLAFVDTSFCPSQDISVSRSTGRIGIAWTKYTPDGRIAGDSFQSDVWIATSTDAGANWTRTNVTNYTGAGYRAWMEVSCLWDSADKFHVIWNGSYTDGTDFGSRSCRLFHWSEWNPSHIYTIYDAFWDPAQTNCVGGDNVMNVGHFSIAECDGRMYTIFSSWNDPVATGQVDDCCASANRSYGANGEVFVSISKDLQGKSWDTPRNLSRSYYPSCDTGTCVDDRWGVLSRYGMDSALYGVQNWSSAVTEDLSTGYSGTKYLQVWYMTDRYPGNGTLSSGAVGPVTLNDMRWVRLACVQPVTAALLSVSPNKIDYPEFTKPGVAKQYTLFLENTGNTTLTFTSIQNVEDSTKGPGGPISGWLSHTGAPASLLEGFPDYMTLTVNAGGIVNYPNVPKVLFGKLRFAYTPPARVLELPVRMTVADSIKFTRWDTLATQCNIRLAVGTNGNMGQNYAGNVNMSFPPFTQGGPECDTGISTGRGNADIYLGDASPVIIRKSGVSTYVASWAIFDGGFESPSGFKPLSGYAADGFFSTAAYEGFNSGTFCTSDSLVKVEKTWFAPKSSADSCTFIIQRMRVFPFTIGASVTGLAIGEAFDWEIPSDTGAGYAGNVGGTDPGHRMVYIRGYNRNDTVTTDCFDNSKRYAGAALLHMHFKNCVLDSSLYGGYNAANDAFVYPSGGFLKEELWANMQTSGYANEARVTDLHSVLIYKNTAANGFTLPANDTLTIWTAMAVTRGAATTVAGLDSLKTTMDRAKKWYFKRSGVWDKCTGPVTCCDGVVGNVNMSGIVDLSDLSLLISYCTTIPAPTLPCPAEADMSSDGRISFIDLSMLVDYLTGGCHTLAPCP